MQILLIDNDDSFTNNLQHQLVRAVLAVPEIISYSDLKGHDLYPYDLFVISAGPGSPEEYPVYKKVFETNKPVLGICLGMQILNVFFGGSVGRLSQPRHGVVKNIIVDGENYECAIYNSLFCTNVSDCFDILAEHDGVPMWIKHKEKPFAAVQFHTESFLTIKGDKILIDVLSSIGINR